VSVARTSPACLNWAGRRDERLLLKGWLVPGPPAARLIKGLWSPVGVLHVQAAEAVAFEFIDVMLFLLADVAAVGLPPFPRLPTRSLNPVLQSCKHAPVTSLPIQEGCWD
jgi:hypothetical protein